MCRNVFSGAVFRVAGLLGNAEVPFGGLCVYRSHQGFARICNAEAGDLVMGIEKLELLNKYNCVCL